MNPKLKDMLERFDSYFIEYSLMSAITKEEIQDLVRIYYLVGGITLGLWDCKLEYPDFYISEQEKKLVLLDYFNRFKKLLNTHAIRNAREPWLTNILTDIIDSPDPKIENAQFK